MESAEVRSQFLDFFARNKHQVLESAPLLPSDPELLFNIAGMVPFKPYFLGEESPPSPRLTTSQKCLRTADIENVGHTARHLTFFEMLGNFSFGDYFKEEAIKLAWAFLTEELGLEPDRLWISVFGGSDSQDLKPDAEARSLWQNKVGIPADRVLEFGPEENFWAMDETGPCGPCSEILYDQKSDSASPGEVKNMVKAGEDRILELWNLVFMQYDRDEQANLSPLPQQNIDTGLGLERLCAVLQDKPDNFSTDLFQPLIEETKKISPAGENALDNSALRIIADHVRAASFLLSEGLLPGNEGRGYILRRLIRRASRWGRKLELKEPFLFELVPTVIKVMGSHFDELKEKRELIEQNLRQEEEQFNRTLDRGLAELQDQIRVIKSKEESRLAGEDIFRLYETHGFPVEMTEEILREEEIAYDEEEIEIARRKHQQESRSATGTDSDVKIEASQLEETIFTGYDNFTENTTVKAIYRGEKAVDGLAPGEEGQVVLERTPFYAERGGQVGDTGRLDDFKVEDTVEKGGCVFHLGKARQKLERGQGVEAAVDVDRRRSIMRHHTATHLLQAALRDRLGDQVIQNGSQVNPGYLRFDFTYNQRVSRDHLAKVEEQVNNWIYQQLSVTKTEKKRRQAEKDGALAFFGEHYGEEVRVIRICDEQSDSDYVSQELCGGTHVDNTVELGVFVIIDETSVAAGVRRIEARAGHPAYEFLTERRKQLRAIRESVGVQRYGEIVPRFEELEETVDSQAEELESFRQKQAEAQTRQLIEEAKQFGDLKFILKEFQNSEQETLKKLIDSLRDEIQNGVVLLINQQGSSVQLLLGATDDIAPDFQAGEIIGKLGRLVGGGGGGSPAFAQAGGSDPDGIDEVKSKINSLLADRYGPDSGN